MLDRQSRDVLLLVFGLTFGLFCWLHEIGCDENLRLLRKWTPEGPVQ